MSVSAKIESIGAELMMCTAAITAFVVWSVAATPLVAQEDCPFLSNTEVEELTGRKLMLFRLRAMQLPDAAGTACDSEIVRVIVLPGENSESRWDNMIEGYDRAQEKRIPLTGFGDKAYALNLEPRTEHEYPTALVVVTSGSYTAAVSVQAKRGAAAESVQSQAIELTKVVISRIK